MLDGKNILVYLYVGDDWIATACEQAASLTMTSEFINVTRNDFSRGRIPTITDWSLQGNGLVAYNRKASALFMQNTINNRTKVSVKFYTAHPDGYAIKSGDAWFSQVAETGEVNRSVSYNYALIADGPLSIESIIPQEDAENILTGFLMTNDAEFIINDQNELIETG